MQSGFVEESLFREIQQAVPIVCVDLLVFEDDEAGVRRYGLIARHDTAGITGWNLIGGRIRLDETVAEAAVRHLHETLGSDVQVDPAVFEAAPAAVGQYFPVERPGYPVDERQHAVALTYLAELAGAPIVGGGEALDFCWFTEAQLPRRHEWGFRQFLPVEQMLAVELD